MTSDAKIGLLLGLVFIFVIAFIINGIPRGDKAVNNSELTTNMVGPQTGPPGLGGKERKVQTAFFQVETTEPQKAAEPYLPQAEPQTRFRMPLPQGPSEYQQVAVVQPPAGIVTQPQQSQATVPVVAQQPAPTAGGATGKIYVVADGDSLSSIAKKFYGAEAGNKVANLNRLYEANRAIVRSPDELRVGQRILIPPLPASEEQPALLAGSQFERVESVGARAVASQQTVAQESKPAAGRTYRVREGETLWKIAASQLGDGSRYKEIAKMNSDVLADEDTLEVGMLLKLPAK